MIMKLPALAVNVDQPLDKLPDKNAGPKTIKHAINPTALWNKAQQSVRQKLADARSTEHAFFDVVKQVRQPPHCPGDGTIVIAQLQPQLVDSARSSSTCASVHLSQRRTSLASAC